MTTSSRASNESRSRFERNRGSLRGEGDLPVLGTAVAAGCDYIITGDDDLLSVGEHEGVKIVSPRSFWEKMKRGKHR